MHEDESWRSIFIFSYDLLDWSIAIAGCTACSRAGGIEHVDQDLSGIGFCMEVTYAIGIATHQIEHAVVGPAPVDLLRVGSCADVQLRLHIAVGFQERPTAAS